jgi:hypothetical protein
LYALFFIERKKAGIREMERRANKKQTGALFPQTHKKKARP